MLLTRLSMHCKELSKIVFVQKHCIDGIKYAPIVPNDGGLIRRPRSPSSTKPESYWLTFSGKQSFNNLKLCAALPYEQHQGLSLKVMVSARTQHYISFL